MKKNQRKIGKREPSPPSTGAGGAPLTEAEEGVATAKILVLLAAILVWAQGAAWTVDRNDGGSMAVRVAAATVAVGGNPDLDPPAEPFIHPSMAPEVRAKLKNGLELAAERVREVEACGGLFDRLGKNGLDVLNATLYLQVNSHLREVRICGRDGASNSLGANALAYTRVGAASTWICRNFSRVPTELAAVTVLHEALHHAGLHEWPNDRTAMTSKEITQMVKKACDF